MMMTSVRSRKESLQLLVPLLTSVCVTLFLFYIDESAYNFNWMTDWGNWFVFFVYTIILLMAQLMIQLLFFKKYTGWTRHAAVALTGIPLGVLLAVGLFWLWMSVNS